jgi:RimJ/RimL family protein N-acetyltransferase
VDARNARSLRVVEKLGMTREGVLRRHIKRHEVRIDDVYYGVLREEWDATNAKEAGLGPA